MDELVKVKQDLTDKLVSGLTQLATQLVEQMVPAHVEIDKAEALAALTTQELLAEVSKRVG